MDSANTKIDKKLIRRLVIFVGLIALTFGLIFRNQDMSELYRIIMSVDKRFLALGAFLTFFSYVIEAYNVKRILIALGEKKISIFRALRYTFIGFFFSAITPASTGGQPVEVYYMSKDNISVSNATMSLLIELCGFHICTLLIGLICAILGPHLLEGGLFWFFLLGFTISGIALFLMLMCIFSRRLSEKLVNAFIKLLEFFRIKNIDKIRNSIEEELDKYHDSLIFIKSHKVEFAKGIVRVLAQVVVYYSVPYCVYRAFGLNEYSLFQVFQMQAILHTIVLALPFPGTIGASEYAFLKIFEPIYGAELLGSAVLLTRGTIFYLFVILSLPIVIISAFKKRETVAEIEKNSLELKEKKVDHLKKLKA